MKQHILVAVNDFNPEQLHSIQCSVKEWAVVNAIQQDSPEDLYRRELDKADICIGWPQPAWIKKSNVKLLQIGSSGWDDYQHKGLENIDGFSFCTAKGIYTIGVAEHAIAMMFALVRRLPVHVRDKEQARFKRHLPYAAEITGATACIIGMGAVGTLLAAMLKGLGMTVTGVAKNTGTQLQNVDKLMPVAELKQAVAAADHIFLLVPGTPENENIFDESIFSCCKPSAFFYNLSRGNNVNEDALYMHLKENKIAGAGLDVTRKEPLPADSKLWQLGDNVLITGHSAGLSTGHPQRFCELAIRNLHNFHHHLPMENKVI